MVKQSIAINFMPGRVQPYLKASKGDTGERVFDVYCYTDEEPYEIPAGSTVVINGNKPGNYFFVLPCTYSGNKVTFDCTNTMTDVCGQVVCELAVMSGAGVVQSANFILYVERPVVDTEDMPASDYQALTDILADAEDAARRAEEAASELAINSKTSDGLVLKGGTNANKVWGTDGDGNPAWRDAVQLANNMSQATAGQKALDAVQANPSVAGSFAARTKGVFAPNVIPDNADLNTYVTPGEYYKGANVGTLVNCPTINAIRLTVETIGAYTATPGIIRQTIWSLISTDAKMIYTRTTTAAQAVTQNWTAWQKFLFQSDLSAGTALALSGNTFNVQLQNGVNQATAGQKALDAVQANPSVAGSFAARTKGVFAPNVIPDNADLNTYVTPGEYYKGANVGTLVNCPTINAIRLTVETIGAYTATPGIIRQTIWSLISTDAKMIYTRTTTAAQAVTQNWTAWRKFIFESDITQNKTVTAVGTKAVDAVELNPNVAGSYAKGVADKFAAIGALVVPTVEADLVSTASGVSKTLCSITIPANTRVLVVGGVLFEANATGVRKCSINSSNTIVDSANKSVTQMAATSGRTAMQFVYFWMSSSDTTLNLNVWQNSGGNLACSAQLFAMKLNQ